jgi:hypothetical protein
MMLTMLFSMLFFDFSPSLEFGCGLSVLLISMYLYHHKVDTSSDDSDDSDSSCHPPKERGATASSGHKSTIIENLTTPSLAAGGLHLKKKHYEKVPNDSSDLELGSPLSERPSRDD